MSDSVVPSEILTAEQKALLRMVYGTLTAQAIYVAVKLGVPDMLKDGPRTCSEVGAAVGVDGSTLRRLLRAVASLGLCAEVDADRFALTGMGQYLRSDRADSLHARVLLNGEMHFAMWGELLNTVRSGESAGLRVFKMPQFEYFARHPEVGELFDRTMTNEARYRLAPAVAAYDFSRFRMIVDIGGGNGALMLAILRSYPEPHGVVFDFPPVAERAQQSIQAAGLSDRCTVLAGDAVDSVPQGADCYVMSNFLVSMKDAPAITILRNCRRVIATGGTVVLIEWVMPTRGEAVDPHMFWDIALMDLRMLAIDGSAGWRVRTAQEFQTLLEEGGFTLARIIPTGSSVSVIEALPV